MTLADVCSDFVHGYDTEETPEPQLTELLKGLDWYSKDYPAHRGSDIDALRRACKRVLARPNDEEALLWLLVLANCVREYRDNMMIWGLAGFLDGRLSHLDIWRADQLRQYENFEKKRCPACGVGPIESENELLKEWVEAHI